MTVFKILKWIFGVFSGALSILLLFYLGIMNENWEVISSEGQVVINKTLGICFIIGWAVIGALFLLFEYLYKRSIKSKN